MAQGSVFAEPATGSEKPPLRSYAGFWRRLLAFVIDWVLISIPCYLLGFAFYDLFSDSNLLAALVGFIMALFYFAILGSSVGEGQTVGHRLTGIEVLNADGRYLSQGESALRYSILLVPILFSGVTLPSYVAWPLYWAGTAIVYLYIFNSKTRRSLHDLATGAFVVEKPGYGKVESKRLWPWHWAILSAVAVLGIAGPSILERVGPFQELLAVQKALVYSGMFRDVGVTLQSSNARVGLVISVVCKRRPSNYDKAAEGVVAIVEKADPHAAERDFISVTFREGFHIGLASFSRAQSVTYSPQQWQDMMQKEN
ncbi:MAG: RDD family protein [Candidatus Sulfotelmatobacter sp.]